VDTRSVQEFAQKVAADQAVALSSLLTSIGDRLGLWSALAASGPVTAEGLARAAGSAPRYVAEWLAAETAAGYVDYDPSTARFTLPPERAAVLADDDSPVAMAGGFEALAGFWAGADRAAEAFRTGAGVPWADHDPRLHSGTARFFGPLYRRSLVGEWLPALDGVAESLERGARVLDVGCGRGLSTRLMAEAFPASRFHGVDPHDPSIRQADAAAVEAGLAGRLTYDVGAAGTDVGGDWDVVCFFDAFHHAGDPAATARWVHKSLAPGGSLVLVEFRAHDRLEDDVDPIHRQAYSASALVCVADALAQGATEALGAQSGPRRLCDLLTGAGFSSARVAAETDVNLVVEARP